MAIQTDSMQAKLLHANECFDSLKNEIIAWIASNPYSLAFQTNPDSTRYSVILRVNNEPPLQRWSLKVGDIVHNLRCTLDHLVYAIAIHESGQDPPPSENRLMFPICDTSDNFRDECKRRLATLSANANAIIEGLQPYNRPHPNVPPLLSILRNFSNTDKHKLLRLAFASAATAEIGFVGPTDMSVVKPKFIVNTGELKDGAEVIAFVFDRPTPNMQFDKHIFDIMIAINHGKPTPSSPEYSERNELVTIISLLVEEVETVANHIVNGIA